MDDATAALQSWTPLEEEFLLSLVSARVHPWVKWDLVVAIFFKEFGPLRFYTADMVRRKFYSMRARWHDGDGVPALMHDMDGMMMMPPPPLPFPRASASSCGNTASRVRILDKISPQMQFKWIPKDDLLAEAARTPINPNPNRPSPITIPASPPPVPVDFNRHDMQWGDDEHEYLKELAATFDQKWDVLARLMRDRFPDRCPYTVEMLRQKIQDVMVPPKSPMGLSVDLFYRFNQESKMHNVPLPVTVPDTSSSESADVPVQVDSVPADVPAINNTIGNEPALPDNSMADFGPSALSCDGFNEACDNSNEADVDFSYVAEVSDNLAVGDAVVSDDVVVCEDGEPLHISSADQPIAPEPIRQNDPQVDVFEKVAADDSNGDFIENVHVPDEDDDIIEYDQENEAVEPYATSDDMVVQGTAKSDFHEDTKSKESSKAADLDDIVVVVSEFTPEDNDSAHIEVPDYAQFQADHDQRFEIPQTVAVADHEESGIAKNSCNPLKAEAVEFVENFHLELSEKEEQLVVPPTEPESVDGIPSQFLPQPAVEVTHEVAVQVEIQDDRLPESVVVEQAQPEIVDLCSDENVKEGEIDADSHPVEIASDRDDSLFAKEVVMDVDSHQDDIQLYPETAVITTEAVMNVLDDAQQNQETAVPTTDVALVADAINLHNDVEVAIEEAAGVHLDGNQPNNDAEIATEIVDMDMDAQPDDIQLDNDVKVTNETTMDADLHVDDTQLYNDAEIAADEAVMAVREALKSGKAAKDAIKVEGSDADWFLNDIPLNHDAQIISNGVIHVAKQVIAANVVADAPAPASSMAFDRKIKPEPISMPAEVIVPDLQSPISVFSHVQESVTITKSVAGAILTTGADDTESDEDVAIPKLTNSHICHFNAFDDIDSLHGPGYESPQDLANLHYQLLAPDISSVESPSRPPPTPKQHDSDFLKNNLVGRAIRKLVEGRVAETEIHMGSDAISQQPEAAEVVTDALNPVTDSEPINVPAEAMVVSPAIDFDLDENDFDMDEVSVPAEPVPPPKVTTKPLTAAISKRRGRPPAPVGALPRKRGRPRKNAPKAVEASAIRNMTVDKIDPVLGYITNSGIALAGNIAKSDTREPLPGNITESENILGKSVAVNGNVLCESLAANIPSDDRRHEPLADQSHQTCELETLLHSSIVVRALSKAEDLIAKENVKPRDDASSEALAVSIDASKLSKSTETPINPALEISLPTLSKGSSTQPIIEIPPQSMSKNPSAHSIVDILPPSKSQEALCVEGPGPTESKEPSVQPIVEVPAPSKLKAISTKLAVERRSLSRDVVANSTKEKLIGSRMKGVKSGKQATKPLVTRSVSSRTRSSKRAVSPIRLLPVRKSRRVCQNDFAPRKSDFQNESSVNTQQSVCGDDVGPDSSANISCDTIMSEALAVAVQDPDPPGTALDTETLSASTEPLLPPRSTSNNMMESSSIEIPGQSRWLLPSKSCLLQ